MWVIPRQLTQKSDLFPFFTRELFDQVSDCLFILTLTYVSFYTWLGGNLNM